MLRPGTGALGAELTESEAALRVFLAAGGLLLAGLVLSWVTIRWWRGTKPEPPALAPLEVMGDRKWRQAADGERRRLIEDHRPDGAVPSNLFIPPEPVDLGELARGVPPSFDDLREPAADPEAEEIAAEEAAAAADVDEVDEADEASADDALDEGDAAAAAEVDESVVEAPDEAVEVRPAAPDGMRAPASDELPAIDADETVAMLAPDRSVRSNAGE